MSRLNQIKIKLEADQEKSPNPLSWGIPQEEEFANCNNSLWPVNSSGDVMWQD